MTGVANGKIMVRGYDENGEPREVLLDVTNYAAHVHQASSDVIAPQENTYATTITIDLLTLNDAVAVPDIEGYSLCYVKVYSPNGDGDGTVSFKLDISDGGASSSPTTKENTGKLAVTITSNSPYSNTVSTNLVHNNAGRIQQLAGSKLWAYCSGVDTNTAADPTVQATVYLFFKGAA